MVVLSSSLNISNNDARFSQFNIVKQWSSDIAILDVSTLEWHWINVCAPPPPYQPAPLSPSIHA